MTIDPKAAELAKALADAVAAQQTEEYQEMERIAGSKALIDSDAKIAAERLEQYYAKKHADQMSDATKFNQAQLVGGFNEGFLGHTQHDHLFDSPSDPAHYTLPTDEDETATAKPNGGLSD